MNVINAAREMTEGSGTERVSLCPRFAGITGLCDRRRLKKKMPHTLHFLVHIRSALLKGKKAGYVRSTPSRQTMTVIAAMPEARPEKIDLGRRILHCSNSELDEKLNKAMDRMMEKLLQGE